MKAEGRIAVERRRDGRSGAEWFARIIRPDGRNRDLRAPGKSRAGTAAARLALQVINLNLRNWPRMEGVGRFAVRSECASASGGLQPQIRELLAAASSDGFSETHGGRRKRLRGGLLDSIQNQHPRNRDDQGRDAAKQKRLHPQPPSIEPASHLYDTACGGQAHRSRRDAPGSMVFDYRNPRGCGRWAVALHASEPKQALQVYCRPSERIGGPA